MDVDVNILFEKKSFCVLAHRADGPLPLRCGEVSVLPQFSSYIFDQNLIKLAHSDCLIILT